MASSAPRHDSILRATWTGIKHTFVRGEAFGALSEAMRWPGGTALVTGASSGLGFAIAVELARRGMRVIGVARRATPELTQSLREAAGSEAIELLPVDLADLDSVDALLTRLSESGVSLDLLLCNAAIVPTHDQRTPQGLEQMFVVNYLANHVLVAGLLERGCLAKQASASQRAPRIVVIASEAHRDAAPLDLPTLGDYQPFSIGEVLQRYGTYKLALLTWATELGRRLEAQGIGVHAICPGAVDTQLAREAPAWAKPLLRVAFRLFFQAPRKAAEPCVYLGLAPQLDGQTGVYLHQWTRKQADPRALDPEQGRAQWAATEAALARLGRSSP